jgi:CheY-like chemotaxis protein
MVRVLIVDDHPAFLPMLKEELVTLRNLLVVGYAHSGREALEKVDQLQPDLVLLDIAMPDMNGLEVARHIKTHVLRSS